MNPRNSAVEVHDRQSDEQEVVVQNNRTVRAITSRTQSLRNKTNESLLNLHSGEALRGMETLLN
jgi:hypothetical protein